jgi:Rab-GTPase-TBC domain
MTIEQLRYNFRELHPRCKQSGLADVFEDMNEAESFILSRTLIGEEVVRQNCCRVARQFAKQGCPESVRHQVWDLALQSDRFNPFELLVSRTIPKLRAAVAHYDLLIDHLLQVDTKHCQNHDNFFVFEDVLREALLYWSRDPWIRKDISAPMFSKGAEDIESASPPNGILPFWGLSLYAMPICYLHSDSGHVYMTFREMYKRYKHYNLRYFYNLHSVTNQSGSLLDLCILFENLLKQSDAELFFHLSYNLGINPIDIAFKWILYAFVGILEVDQVLLMWDRIVGFDNPSLLAVTAAELVVFRRDMLLASNDSHQVKVVSY